MVLAEFRLVVSPRSRCNDACLHPDVCRGLSMRPALPLTAFSADDRGFSGNPEDGLLDRFNRAVNAGGQSSDYRTKDLNY